jgi:hypothetical protein
MASKPITYDDLISNANDNHVGVVTGSYCKDITLPPVTLETAHLARRPSDEERHIQRVTAALRGRLAELAAARRALDECREPDG